MSKKKKKKYAKDQVNVLAYIIAGLSFIPLCGVLFGIIAIGWGLFNIDHGGKKVLAIGAAGILLTFVLYGALYYIGGVERGGIADEARTLSAKRQLLDLVKSIEYFKLQNGHYPGSLEEMQIQSISPVFIHDPLDTHGSRLFHYELDSSGEFYYLLSVGIDGQIHTNDDILPDISQEEQKNLGYRTKE